MAGISSSDREQAPQFFDRGPADLSTQFDVDAEVPHGVTLRGTITVPPLQAAILNFGRVQVVRSAAAAAAGRVIAYVLYTPSGGQGQVILWAEHPASTNAVGDFVSEALTVQPYMEAGDKVEIYTLDTSTGGTCDYRCELNTKTFTPKVVA